MEDQSNSNNLKRSRPPVVIEISSDEDQDDQILHPSKKKIINEPSSSNANTFPSRQERLKLESERLSRQRQREHLNNSSSSTTSNHQSINPLNHKNNHDPSVKHYWDSSIFRTFNRWKPNSTNSIRIEEIIGPKTSLKIALVSSYVADLAWIHGLFDSTTRIMVIKHDPEEGTFKVNERQNMFLCHPPLRKTANCKTRSGCMHIKFFILYYDTFCRVAITTANAVDFDYDIIENSVWIQDFPLAVKITGQQQTAVSSFQRDLEALLQHMGVPSVFSKPLDDFNFQSAAANLIVSIQGTHPLPESKMGQLALAKELKSMGLQSGCDTGRHVILECMGSSIGAYDTSWLQSFHSCACGQTPGHDIAQTSQASKTNVPITILFPTLQTIKSSLTGTQGAGTIFCNKSVWQKAGFPTTLFADAISKRSGVLMHVKMILGLFSTDLEPEKKLAQGQSTSEDGSTPYIHKNALGFLYIGSHNFTPAAWGRFVTKGNPKEYSHLDISNWELGVICSLTSNEQIEQYIPWERPVRKYGHGSKDSKIPWMQHSYR
ncbi:hypothetical protein O181_009851 [Austropuccinia psidii MF-1]|uniref:PLD phosphodiesterase domain-containing protein n=1 Tax=Austropuccinia psidii MF-1 TaxID=1389203 RepID=A0A9Q3BSM5_9BASI|nr:hypothetical protein [Austropuccinia psidii MF-1]